MSATGTNAEVYSIQNVADLIGAPAPVVGFLVTDREIPHRVFGRYRMVDANGLAMVRDAYADYRSKNPAVPSATTRKRATAR